MTNKETLEPCIGCGVQIQTSDPKGLGYTPEKAYQKGLENGQVYCQRCFRLRNYNELQAAPLTDGDFLNLLSSIGETDALVVYVLDVFDAYGSVISGLKRFVGDNPILLVGNKVDLFPKSINKNKIKNWIEKLAKDYGLKPVDTLLVSGNKRYQIDLLLETIETLRKGKNVYVVGVTNVGKSTLINRIIQSLGDERELITTSQFPGTTLDQIYIPFGDDTYLIDTPGIIHRHQITHYLSEKDVKKVLPQKELQPKTFQLNAEQTIFIGALARVDYKQGQRNSFTFYTPHQIELHRTKLVGADDFYPKHKGELLTPPSGSQAAEEYPQLVASEFSIKEKSDIVIAGLGWVTIQNPGIVTVWTPKEVDVIVRKSIV